MPRDGRAAVARPAIAGGCAAGGHGCGGAVADTDPGVRTIRGGCCLWSPPFRRCGGGCVDRGVVRSSACCGCRDCPGRTERCSPWRPDSPPCTTSSPCTSSATTASAPPTTGLTVLAFPLGMALAGPLGGRLADRYGCAADRGHRGHPHGRRSAAADPARRRLVTARRGLAARAGRYRHGPQRRPDPGPGHGRRPTGPDRHRRIHGAIRPQPRLHPRPRPGHRASGALPDAGDGVRRRARPAPPGRLPRRTAARAARPPPAAAAPEKTTDAAPAAHT